MGQRTSFQKAMANAMLITGPWPTHTLGHDKYQTVMELMEHRTEHPDEVLWFLVTYVFDLERRFSMLRVALDDVQGNETAEAALAARMVQDELALNVNGSGQTPQWQHMAGIAATHMRYWLERADEVNPLPVGTQKQQNIQDEEQI